MTTGPDPGVDPGERFILKKNDRKGKLDFYRVEAVDGADTLVAYVLWDDGSHGTVHPWHGDTLEKL